MEGDIMKKFMMSCFVALVAVVFAGCCTGSVDCKSKCAGKKACVKKADCKKPCAKAKKCPFLGKWEFFVNVDGKLEPLPVSPQPQLELCAKGVMRFHYAKNDQPAVMEGKWKVADGNLVISDIAQKNVQKYILKKDGTAEFTVGKNDRMPENTKVVIRKVK